jgi:hypothetical protein
MDDFLLAPLSMDSRDSQEGPLDRNGARAGSSSRICEQARSNSGASEEHDWGSKCTTLVGSCSSAGVRADSTFESCVGIRGEPDGGDSTGLCARTSALADSSSVVV